MIKIVFWISICAGEMAGAEGMAEKQGYLGNLEKKSRTELKDLLNRQEKILGNKYVAGEIHIKFSPMNFEK